MDACPECGNEVRGQGGYFNCECPAPLPLPARIFYDVRQALDNATHENGYPHESERPAFEIVSEIDDWSGIVGYDPENSDHVKAGIDAVAAWRSENPKPS